MFQYSKQPQLDGIVAFAGERRSYHCLVQETSAKVYWKDIARTEVLSRLIVIVRTKQLR